MKIKHLFLGFVIGAVIFSTIPIKAAIEEYVLYKADYKIMVDGNEYADQELPILNYKGNTYIPLRKVSDLLGVKLNWNAELGQAEITKSSSEQGVNTMATTNIDLTKWISLRDFARTYPDAYNKYIRAIQDQFRNSEYPTGEFSVESSMGPIRALFGNYTNYLNIDDLKKLGLIK
jgi:hypothetical protein